LAGSWILLLVAMLAAAPAVPAQDAQASGHARKVVNRVIPSYPELARKIGIKARSGW